MGKPTVSRTWRRRGNGTRGHPLAGQRARFIFACLIRPFTAGTDKWSVGGFGIGLKSADTARLMWYPPHQLSSVGRFLLEFYNWTDICSSAARYGRAFLRSVSKMDERASKFTNVFKYKERW